MSVLAYRVGYIRLRIATHPCSKRPARFGNSLRAGGRVLQGCVAAEIVKSPAFRGALGAEGRCQQRTGAQFCRKCQIITRRLEQAFADQESESLR
jgi:hypothetical protein